MVDDVVWTEVESSNIEAVRVEVELFVKFKGGAVYNYHDVPYEVAKGFFDAESKGKYLNQHIKGVYAYKKL